MVTTREAITSGAHPYPRHTHTHASGEPRTCVDQHLDEQHERELGHAHHVSVQNTAQPAKHGCAQERRHVERQLWDRPARIADQEVATEDVGSKGREEGQREPLHVLGQRLVPGDDPQPHNADAKEVGTAKR